MTCLCVDSVEVCPPCKVQCKPCISPCRCLPCCCCCMKIEQPVVAKKRSRLGDIFKGASPNLEDLIWYQKMQKDIEKRNKRGKQGKGIAHESDYGGKEDDGGDHGGGDRKYKWKDDDECRPNQERKCPFKCTLKPKKCSPDQIKPCDEACLRGTPYDEPKCHDQQTTPCAPTCRAGLHHTTPGASNGFYCNGGGLNQNANWGMNQNYPQMYGNQQNPAYHQTMTGFGFGMQQNYQQQLYNQQNAAYPQGYPNYLQQMVGGNGGVQQQLYANQESSVCPQTCPNFSQLQKVTSNNERYCAQGGLHPQVQQVFAAMPQTNSPFCPYVNVPTVKSLDFLEVQAQEAFRQIQQHYSAMALKAYAEYTNSLQRMFYSRGSTPISNQSTIGSAK